MRILLFFLLLTLPLSAELFVPDASSRSYESREVKKMRVDTYDFSGDFPELENINIDAKRKKNVELILNGHYPELQRVTYEGSFGLLSGIMTGEFPKLSQLNVICTHCAMQLDLTAPWRRSCTIQIRGGDQDVILTLPKDVGLEIHTKVAVKGKVVPFDGLKKKEKFGILKKTYTNELAETAPIRLTIHVEVTEGRIILN